MPTEGLLKTKLLVPIARPGLIFRPRLVDKVKSGLRLKLVLVSAPAGFGKTTLVSEAVRGSQLPAGWVSLDEHDNDPTRFWSYFIAALQDAQPGVGESVLGLLRSSQAPPLESMLTILVNDILNTGSDFALVLDDYHTIESKPIHSGIAFILDNLPKQMHLVIASRTDPSLPLARLRGRASMIEVRAEDLRFTTDEAAVFLNEVMGLNVGSSDIEALESRTEGWITGLQMAALSLQKESNTSDFISAFTGSHRYILDYLMDEVLRRQPDDIQRFLLQTSILDRLTASLCDAVTERTDSQHVLLSLERDNLFLVPLDQSRQWCRYEHLFRDLLRHQLASVVTPTEIGLLHARASAWSEANGFTADAIQHAIEAQDWDRSAVLIHAANDTLIKRGEVITLVDWIKSLPADVLRSHPELFSDYVWALILTGQIDLAESYLRQAKEETTKESAGYGMIVAMEAYIARLRGDGRGTNRLSERALSLLPKDDYEVRGIVALNLGMASWQRGNLAQAGDAFTEADQDARRSNNEYAEATAKSFLGAIEASRGRLRRARTILEEAVRVSGGPAGALSHVYLGALLYEHNELGQASARVQQGLVLSRQSGNREIQIGALRILAYIHQAANDTKNALNALREADDLAKTGSVSEFERARNISSHVIVALAQGDIAAATEWARRISEDADVSPFYPRLNLTGPRVLIAQNRKEEASQRLAALHERAVDGGWRFAQIEIRSLQVLAAHDATTALAFLDDVLQEGQEETYVRTFLDKGEPMADLLRRARAQRIAAGYVSRLLAFFQTEAKAHNRLADAEASLPQPLAEPLSPRELAVLRLLSAGLSNREIADKLVISTGTAKTHVHNIIGKLSVTGRTQAISRARELGFI